MSSGGNCIRTYRPEIKKGNYNTVILNVKTTVADNLLFYLGSNRFVSLVFCFPFEHFTVQLKALTLVEDENVITEAVRRPGEE